MSYTVISHEGDKELRLYHTRIESLPEQTTRAKFVFKRWNVGRIIEAVRNEGWGPHEYSGIKHLWGDYDGLVVWVRAPKSADATRLLAELKKEWDEAGWKLSSLGVADDEPPTDLAVTVGATFYPEEGRWYKYRMVGFSTCSVEIKAGVAQTIAWNEWAEKRGIQPCPEASAMVGGDRSHGVNRFRKMAAQKQLPNVPRSWYTLA